MPAHQFELLREEHIEELNTRALFYRHSTGAELLSLINDDENKVFGINFRTPPTDSTGVAHIIEHAVLCGSRKYPVKEPFVELIKGSLNTFLNAFTYPDKTCYPVASTNLKDFYNLIDVYLDAVFYPRITPQVLEQEGWHYEVEEDGAKLSYKGVVFNEMKGAYSDPERVAAEFAQHSLFPDNTYGVESGGHPRAIPDLSFEQFKTFHEDYYHPSNARIFFYGDDDAEQRLVLLEEYLGDFEPKVIDSDIGPQPRFAAPKRLEHVYAAEAQEEGGKCYITVNWLLEEEVDPDERRGLQILDYALLGTPGSALRKVLIDSGLGEDLTGSGLETEMKQIFFGAGLKGVREENVDAVEKLLLDTLAQIEREGVDKGMVAAGLNTAEFRLRENNTGSYPRGLGLMLRCLARWLYDRDPYTALRFEDSLAQLRKNLEGDERFLEKLLRRHLLENNHRTTVVLKPDEELAERQEREEQERLAAVRAQMSDAELAQVAEAARKLQEAQERPDDPADLAKLPRLELSDLDKKIKTIPIEEVQLEGARVLHHDLFTNRIAYLDMGFDMSALPQEYLPYVSLFGRALLEMGTEKEDFVQLQQRIGAQTGGLWTHPIISRHRQGDKLHALLFVRGKTTVARAAELMDILRDVLLTARLDDKARFLQMVLEEKAGEESGLVPGGHRVVSLRLRSRFDKSAWVSEQMGGINYLFFLRELIAEIERDWPAVQRRLEEMRALIFNRSGLLCNVTLGGEDRAPFDEELGRLLAQLPAAGAAPQIWTPDYGTVDEGLVIPAQVNYVGKAANLYDLGYELHGSSSIITRYLGASWLWDRVRVQGGAYGAFCSFDSFSGILSYASYRDPNVLQTLKNYDGSGGFLRQLDINDDELSKAIIGAVGDLDSYQLPDSKGYTSMMRDLTGVDDVYRQRIRDEILGTTAVDFRAFADVLDAAASQGAVAVLGSEEAIDAANAEQENFLQKIKVL
jgi:presequence protease